MYDTLAEEAQRNEVNMDEQQNGEEKHEPAGNNTQETQLEETIHIHYFPDAIVICKEGEADQQEDNLIEATLVEPKQPPVFIAYAMCTFYLFLMLSCIAFQVYEILNPPIATVTIIPTLQTVTLTGTLQIGRLLTPLTVSQSQTVPTTGTGHQDARQAIGAITFYNGLFTPQTIPSGTIVAGPDGVQIITDQNAFITAANPPSLGQTTVAAHTIQTGTRGNLPAYGINSPCCQTAVKAVNTQSFRGGQDERDFSTVSKKDMNTVSTQLISTLSQSMRGALQGQLTPQEQLHLLPCTPTVTSDHRIGQEAPTVTVTVSETCSAVAYNKAEVDRKAADLLNRQAGTKIGTAYNIFGNTHVHVTQAAISHTPHPLVFVSFEAFGTWIYALSPGTQQQIKTLIAGKTTHVALQLLISLPGVKQASLRFSGFGDDTRLPKNSTDIHLSLFVL